MTDTYNMLTVYLGSSGYAKDIYKKAAKDLGQLIGQSGKSLVYGGMDAGLMGILARSALQNGAEVTGIVPHRIKDSERILEDISEIIMVKDLCDRKRQMFLMADAVIVLPGGFGTLDESLEMLYWGSQELHNKHLVFVNIDGYWNTLIEFLKGLKDFDERYMSIVDTVEEVIPALENASAIPTAKTPLNLPNFEDEITRDTAQPIIIDRANLENTYYAVCALGLKQLGKHDRPMGFLNTNGQFDGLLEWFKRAQKETFITEKCLKLYAAHENEEMLHVILQNQEHIHIDLHKEKWGPK